MDETLTTVDAQLERIVLAMESINAIIEADNGGGGAKSVQANNEKKVDEPIVKEEEIDEPKEEEPKDEEPKDEPIEKKLNLDDLDKVGDDDAEY